MLSAQIQESPEPNVLALCLIDELYSVVAQLGGADMAQQMIERAKARAANKLQPYTPPRLTLVK